MCFSLQGRMLTKLVVTESHSYSGAGKTLATECSKEMSGMSTEDIIATAMIVMWEQSVQQSWDWGIISTVEYRIIATLIF